MDLNQLRERGGIAPSSTVKAEVSWTHELDGQPVTDTFTVHVVKPSFGAVERMLAASAKDPERSQAVAFIAECIRLGGDGSGRLSYDDAFNLESGLARALMDAISSVNATGGPEKN